MRHLGSWIRELLLSVPEDLQFLLVIPFDICSKLKNSPFNHEIHRVFYLLSALGVDASGWRHWTTSFLELIIPRVPIAFGLEFPMTDSHYTDFAAWKAARAAVG